MNKFEKIGWFQTVSEYVRCSTQYCSVYYEEEKMMTKQLNNSCLAPALIARGSLCELETQVIIARELGYVSGSDDTVLMDINELFAKLSALMNSITNKVK